MPDTPNPEAVMTQAEAFAQSEASVRLEGIDPTSFPEYVALRDRVIVGELTTEQAIELLVARYKG